MFTASAKIRKAGGVEADEFEQSISQVCTLTKCLKREILSRMKSLSFSCASDSSSLVGLGPLVQ